MLMVDSSEYGRNGRGNGSLLPRLPRNKVALQLSAHGRHHRALCGDILPFPDNRPPGPATVACTLVPFHCSHTWARPPFGGLRFGCPHSARLRGDGGFSILPFHSRADCSHLRRDSRSLHRLLHQHFTVPLRTSSQAPSEVVDLVVHSLLRGGRRALRLHLSSSAHAHAPIRVTPIVNRDGRSYRRRALWCAPWLSHPALRRLPRHLHQCPSRRRPCI